MRNYEKKEKRRKICNDIFEVFAKIFAYSISPIILIVTQFVIIVKSVGFVIHKTEGLENFVPWIPHLLVLLSAFFYGCAHVACRSYNRHAQAQVNGPFRYKKRALENFFVGLLLFLITLAITIPLIF